MKHRLNLTPGTRELGPAPKKAPRQAKPVADDIPEAAIAKGRQRDAR
jgi:hypothetical protein